MAAWTDGYWMSDEGLRLHYRDYPASQESADRPPIICIPGLTRNARDFEGVAERLSGEWRLICVDLRGRGESAYARNAMSYVPPVYLGDLETLISELGLRQFILFGTSLGGLMTMLLALRDSNRVVAALLNDIGPDIDPEGVARIRGYLGRSQSWPTWLHAARHFATSQQAIYPKWKLRDWLAQAKRLCRLNSSGRIVLDYDMRIAEPFKSPEPTDFDMWTAFAALRDVPTLVLRGERSDILAMETVERMKREHSGLEVVTIPNIGHTPMIEESQAIEAVDRLLDRALD